MERVIDGGLSIITMAGRTVPTYRNKGVMHKMGLELLKDRPGRCPAIQYLYSAVRDKVAGRAADDLRLDGYVEILRKVWKKKSYILRVDTQGRLNMGCHFPFGGHIPYGGQFSSGNHFPFWGHFPTGEYYSLWAPLSLWGSPFFRGSLFIWAIFPLEQLSLWGSLYLWGHFPFGVSLSLRGSLSFHGSSGIHGNWRGAKRRNVVTVIFFFTEEFLFLIYLAEVICWLKHSNRMSQIFMC